MAPVNMYFSTDGSFVDVKVHNGGCRKDGVPPTAPSGRCLKNGFLKKRRLEVGMIYGIKDV